MVHASIDKRIGQIETILQESVYERRSERLDITGLCGVTAAQRTALVALGAIDRSDDY